MTQQNLFDEPHEPYGLCPVCGGTDCVPGPCRKNSIYNAEESERRKEEGMKQAADNHPTPLALAKAIAVKLAMKHGETNADEVGIVLESDYNIRLGPEAGSMFPKSKWEFTGKRVRSTKESNHGREIKVWRLKTQ